MLKVFTRAGPAQSLADSKERDRFLRQVAALEPHRALEELRRRVGLVAGDSSVRPEARAGIVYALDSAGAGPVQRIGGEYLLAARLSKSQEMLLWDSLHGFCAATARAYLDCFDGVAPSVRAATEHKTFAAPIAVRALRALGQQLKLEHVRYGPLDPDIWTNVARVYGRIEAAGIARLPVPEAPGAPARITPETEFVRIAMFSVCSPGSLLPLQIEVADRLTGRYARLFKISRRRSAATPYRFDLDQGSPPVRCVGPTSGGLSARYFGAEAAYQELVGLKQQIATFGEIPEDLAMDGRLQPGKVVDVIDHLAQYWAPKVSGRQHPRHRIKSRVTVAWGLDGALDALDPVGSRPAENRAMESWIVENVSAGGVGALVPSIPGEWLQVGCLVAMLPEGGRNWILGTVKRLRRNDESGAQVGIQTLARSPTPVAFRIQLDNATAFRAETGILLDPGISEAEVPVVMRARTSQRGRTFVLERDGRRTQLVPIAVMARGPDYEVARCRQLVRSKREAPR